MLSTNPNELQRLAANPHESAWVGASAGSGKTKVLSDRVLNLLLTGTPPEKILCLTFTRTAAAQMSNKIAERLAKWASVDEDKLVKELTELQGVAPAADLIARARRLFARLLDTAGGLKVTTLHGFCQSLLKRFPLEAGVSPQFDILDEAGAQELIEQAQDTVLGRPENAAVLETITSVAKEDGFLDVLTEVTAHLSALRRITARFPDDKAVNDAYHRMTGLPENATSDSLLRAFCALSADREKDLRAIIATLQVSKTKSDWATAEKIGAFINAPGADRPKLWDTYRDAFLTKDGKVRAKLVCKESAAVLPLATAEAERVTTLKEQLDSARLIHYSFCLYLLGKAFLNEYTGLKNKRGVLDYDDLIATARELLEKSGAAAWVLFKLDGGIDHILVDEAQDTSPDQWAVVKALAEEFFAGDGLRSANRTIFAVGDKKQSIFSFQGAVPEEFERMRDYFKSKIESAHKVLNDVPMYISFRSVQAVIDVVNFVLRSAPARNGVVSENEDATHTVWRKKQAGLIELWPPEEPRKDDTQQPYTKPVERVIQQTPQKRLAEKMAARIAQMVNSKEMLDSAGRPIRPDDILILVRRRNSFIEDLSRELKTLGVPVSGIDRLKITTHIAVKDLMVLGDFLLLPEDDLALATVLRSPLCGLSPKDLSDEDLKKAQALNVPLDGISDDDLFALAYGRGKMTLFDRLKSYADRPDTPLGKAYLFLKDLLARVDNMRPYELYAYVLGPLERRKAFVMRLGEQALDALDEFMSLALQFDMGQAPSLQNFLKTLRQNDVEIKRDPEQSGFNAVRIMTVHASKGLQAPIVFLPDTCQKTFHTPKTFWPKSGDDELPFWPPSAKYRDKTVADELDVLKEKDTREYNRLLYVALTRAADRLYIAGWRNTQKNEGNWYDLVRDALADSPVQQVKTDLFDEPVLRLSCAQEEPPKAAVADTAAEHTAALPEWISCPPAAEPTPPKPLAPSRPDTEEPSAASPLSIGRLKAVKRGLLVHALLEILPQYPAPDRRACAKRLVKMKAADMPEAEATSLIDDVLNLLETTLAADVFAPDSLAEVPVSGVIDNRVVNGKIDRVVVLENEVRLIDYKSGHVIPDTVDATPPAYVHQMSAYKSVMERIYPDKAVRCFLLWTEAPKITEITALCR